MNRGIVRRLAISAILAAFAAGAAASAPVVAVDAGELRGVALEGGAAAFRGIPFAKAPAGPLRWRPPQPVDAWEGVREATAFGPDCPQPSRSGGDAAPQSEDCLTLNVVTPDPKAEKLPVLVSIHGGAFFAGSGRELAQHGASALVREGVVLVAPNYRIGRLGFFAHPALTAESGGKDLANYWLMDQIAALQWVRRNIARFGGDPDRVTILGCSAGGSSINALMAAPAARGLFARASARSGGGFFNATRPLAVAEEQGREFARRTGLDDDAAALARLCELSAQEILALEQGPPNFGAVVDGTWLPEPTSVSFAQGRIARVPYMAGSTSDEASIFGLMGFDRTVLAQRFGIELEALRPVYGEELPEAELLRQVQTDFIFTSAALGMAALASASGAPAYAYHFDYVRPSERETARGAAHCADMAYAFGTLPDPSPADAVVAETMRRQLLAFVREGDPNGSDLPSWPHLDAGRRTPLVIGERIGAVPDFRARQLEYWYRRWERENGQTLPR